MADEMREQPVARRSDFALTRLDLCPTCMDLDMLILVYFGAWVY